MESTVPTPSKIAFKWALIYLVVSIVLTFVLQFLNIDATSPVQYVKYLFFIGFLFLGQKEYKELSGGFVTFGQAFVEGLLFSVFLGIMTAVFTFIYIQYINPHFLDAAMTVQQEKLSQQGNMSSEQIDNAMNIAKKYGAIFGAIGVLIGSPIMGCIISLIGAAIFKKERTLADLEQKNEHEDPSV